MLSRLPRVAAAAVLAAAAALPAPASAAASKNAIINQMPTSPKVDTPIPFSVSVGWNPKDEKTSVGRFLTWSVWLKRGTPKCPDGKMPKARYGWELQNSSRRSTGETTSSISMVLGPLANAGRYRICSYVATAHYRKNSTAYAYDSVKAQDSDVMKVTE